MSYTSHGWWPPIFRTPFRNGKGCDCYDCSYRNELHFSWVVTALRSSDRHSGTVKAESSRNAVSGCGYLFKYMVKFPQLIFIQGTCSCCNLRAMYLNRNHNYLSKGAVILWISLKVTIPPLWLIHSLLAAAGSGGGYLFKYMVKFPQLILLHRTCSCCDLRAMYLNRNRIHLSTAARRLWININIRFELR